MRVTAYCASRKQDVLQVRHQRTNALRVYSVGCGPEDLLVSCPRNRIYFVAMKMGRRQGGVGEASPALHSWEEAKRGRFAYIARPPVHSYRNHSLWQRGEAAQLTTSPEWVLQSPE